MKTQIAPIGLIALAIALAALMTSCGKNYTEADMVGVFKSEVEGGMTLHLKSNNESLMELPADTKYIGDWNRISTDGIVVRNHGGGKVFFKIRSRSRLERLMNPEDAQVFRSMGLPTKPYLNRQ